MQNRSLARLVPAAVVAALPLCSHAQVTQKPDGQWRSLFTAGATLNGGNTNSRSVSLQGDVLKLTTHNKIELDGAGQYASSEGVKTANRENATALYNEDITDRWFGLGQLDLLHDPFANISRRATLGTGIGYHVIKEADNTWDVSGGLAYTWDKYTSPQVIDDVTRTTYNHAEILLSEESNNKLSQTTTFKQKLTVYPNLRDTGDVRTVFDTGLSVAMTQRLALTATFEHRYDSRPAEGLGKTDTQLVTGISLRFD